MTTYTAFTTLDGAAAAEALGGASDALMPAPVATGVFEVEDGRGLWEVGLYFTSPPDQAGLALLAAAHGAAGFAVSRLDDRDWVAQVRRELAPVVAGRFVVHGAHDAHRLPPHRIALEIEAALAFGTGHHATTRGCLLALDALARRGIVPRNTADIGTGTGVLAMAARHLWHTRVVAADIDTTAVATARVNLRANRLGVSVPVIRSAGFQANALAARGPFDLVIANILAGPLRRLAPATARAVAPGGRVVLSGLLSSQARGVLAVYRGQGFHAEAQRALDGWTTLTLRRYRRFPRVHLSC
ncbi:MAG: 50S ribosomal protein L11 methyltransferase [Pseudomonadota bacterium]